MSVELRGISKSYGMSHRAVDNLSLSIKAENFSQSSARLAAGRQPRCG